VLGDFAMDVLVYANASAALNDTVVMYDPVALNDRLPMSANVALHASCCHESSFLLLRMVLLP
jgi:hypothetical protein